MVLTTEVRRILLNFLFWGGSIAGFIIAGYILINYFSLPVNPDAGYYIPVAKEIMKGATPTVDVAAAYTPLGSYLYALWMSCFGSSYNAIIALMLVLHILNAGLLYVAMGYFRTQNYIKILLCFSYFYTAILLDGIYIVLEPFQVFFALLAYISFIRIPSEKWMRYAITGILLGMSIFSKQYSCIYVIAFILMALFENRVHKISVHAL